MSLIRNRRNELGTGTPANWSLSFANTGYVAVPGFNQTLTAATFITWMKRGTADTADGIIFSRGTGTNKVGMIMRTTTQLGYSWDDTAGSQTFNFNIAPPSGAWALVAICVNSTSAIAYMGTGGVVTTGNTRTAAHPSNVMNNVYLGQDSLGGRFYNGLLDEPRIFSRDISLAEFTAIYNSGTIPSGLVGEWKSNEGSGSLVADSSGLWNNGTLTNVTFSSDVPTLGA